MRRTSSWPSSLIVRTSTLRARLRPLAAGLTPRAVPGSCCIQGPDVHFPRSSGNRSNWMMIIRLSRPVPAIRIANLHPASIRPNIAARFLLFNNRLIAMRLTVLEQEADVLQVVQPPRPPRPRQARAHPRPSSPCPVITVAASIASSAAARGASRPRAWSQDRQVEARWRRAQTSLTIFKVVMAATPSPRRVARGVIWLT